MKTKVCFKTLYFLKKAGKNRHSVVGSAPKHPLASGGWGLRPQSCHFRST